MNNLPFNPETGEIFDLEAVREHYRRVEAKKKELYVEAFDVKTITCPEDIYRYNERLYGMSFYPAGVLDQESLLLDWNLTHRELMIMSYLAKRVKHHNYVWFDMKEFMQRVGWSKSVAYEIVKTVKEKMFVKETENKHVLEVHPFFQWVGVNPKRWEVMLNWLSQKSVL